MAILIGLVVVVLVLGLIGFLNITMTPPEKPVNKTIDRVTQPFLGASIILIAIVGFIIFWAIMARTGY